MTNPFDVDAPFEIDDVVWFAEHPEQRVMGKVAMVRFDDAMGAWSILIAFPDVQGYTIAYDYEGKVTHVSAIDRLGKLMPPVERARLALERGAADGLRLLRGEVSMDDLAAELQEDPP